MYKLILFFASVIFGVCSTISALMMLDLALSVSSNGLQYSDVFKLPVDGKYYLAIIILFLMSSALTYYLYVKYKER